MESGLMSFAQSVSSSRAEMFASQLKQVLLTSGSELAFIFTGTEYNFGEYENTRSRRTQNARVLEAIPKYSLYGGSGHNRGAFRINENPTITVIYRGEDDNQIHYFSVDTYTKGSNGFGYENVIKNKVMLQKDWHIPKEETIVTSPGHKDGMYGYGINANVAFMTLDETIEDAMLVSQSFADKMATTFVGSVTIPIGTDLYPLNLYGDETEVKFFPDIGETVRHGGVLCALRPVGKETFLADLDPSALLEPDHQFDKVYYLPEGAKILDVDVYIPSKFGQYPKHLFTQVEKYKEGMIQYYRSIAQVYAEYKDRYPMSPEFNQLATTALTWLSAYNVRVKDAPFKRKMKVTNRRGRELDHVRIEITYAYQRPLSNGFKITGKDGSKGVVCKVIPNEYMPIDQQGFRCDLVIDPASVIARSNPAQFYEQAINRTSVFVQRKLSGLHPANTQLAIETLFDYYNDINPVYANIVRRTKNTPEKLVKHLEDCIANGIYLMIPPFLNTIRPELLCYLQDKWGVVESPVTFTQTDYNGAPVGTFTTEHPVCIGSKYILLLCKIPDPISPGVAFTNQYGTPMRAPIDMGIRSPISQTPARYGEDEHRLILMDLPDASQLVRMMGLQACSPIGVSEAIETILTHPTPSNISRIDITTEELVRTNVPVSLYHHQMATLGANSMTTITDDPMPSDIMSTPDLVDDMDGDLESYDDDE